MNDIGQQSNAVAHQEHRELEKRRGKKHSQTYAAGSDSSSGPEDLRVYEPVGVTVLVAVGAVWRVRLPMLDVHGGLSVARLVAALPSEILETEAGNTEPRNGGCEQSVVVVKHQQGHGGGGRGTPKGTPP